MARAVANNKSLAILGVEAKIRKFAFRKKPSPPSLVVRKGIVLTQDMQGRGRRAVLAEISNEARAEAACELCLARRDCLLWKPCLFRS